MRTPARIALAAVAALALTHFAASSAHAQSAAASVDAVMDALRSVPARNGEKALGEKGFTRLSERFLRAIIGNRGKSPGDFSF